jgi:hypothetical protein
MHSYHTGATYRLPVLLKTGQVTNSLRSDR